MKQLTPIRIKLYFLVLLFGFLFGWIEPRKINLRFEENVTRYDEAFNYALFSIVLVAGFGAIFLYDFIIYFKNRTK